MKDIIETFNINDNNLPQYDTIIKADLVNVDYGIYKGCYLLVGDGILPDLEVELTGDLCFNCDFEKENVEIVKHVETLQDVLDFCKEKNITFLDDTRIGKNFILAGGECDTLILPNLKSHCIYETLYYNNISIYNITNINNLLDLKIENETAKLTIKRG